MKSLSKVHESTNASVCTRAQVTRQNCQTFKSGTDKWLLSTEVALTAQPVPQRHTGIRHEKYHHLNCMSHNIPTRSTARRSCITKLESRCTKPACRKMGVTKRHNCEIDKALSNDARTTRIHKHKQAICISCLKFDTHIAQLRKVVLKGYFACQYAFDCDG